MIQTDNSLSIDIISIIKEYKNIISQQLGEQLISVTLYGSYARGDYNNDSDVDILVIVKEKAQKVDDIIFRASLEIDMKYEVLTSIFVNTVSEINELKNINCFYYQNVKKEGVLIE